jgi:hypothetical protein
LAGWNAAKLGHPLVHRWKSMIKACLNSASREPFQ